jgi:hypothetical protein
MFNFSANHLLLLSRTECRSCVVLVMRDDSTRRVYRLYDKSQIIMPGQYYCVSGKVNSGDKLYLIVESAKPDTKHSSRTPSTRRLPMFPFVPTAQKGLTCVSLPLQGTISNLGCLLVVQAASAFVRLQTETAVTGLAYAARAGKVFIPPLTLRKDLPAADR